MATIIWKDGESTKVEAHALQRHLDAGYTLEKDPPKRRGRKPKADIADFTPPEGEGDSGQ